MNVFSKASDTMVNTANAAVAKLHATLDAKASVLAGVTPESIIMMLRMRMNDVDNQVSQITSQVTEKTNKAQELSRQLEALYALKEQCAAGGSATSMYAAATDDTPTSQMELNGKMVSAHEYLQSFGIGDELKAKKGEGNYAVYTTSQIDTLIDKKKQEIQTVNSGNELAMVQLQNLMQQRSQVISLGSNLLKSLNETKDSIIHNML